MQTLLELHSLGEYGVIKSPNWPYLRDGLKRNLTTILRYYRRNPTAVRAQHFLVRLLGSITVPLSLPVDRYYGNVDSSALNTAMSLNLTSSIYRGKTFKGIFYGPDCHEILIAVDDPFDPFQADKNWQNLCPVKVLRHPRSDLGLNLPDGKETGSETGLVVVTINITMLAVMYRAFRLDQMKQAETNGGLQLTVQHFLRMFVLPNMLASHVDIALFNRFSNMFNDLPMGESTKKHPFLVPNYAHQLDKIYSDLLQSLKKKKMDFVGTLKTIPAVMQNDMFDVFTPPDIAPTRQVIWALVCAQLPVTAFLFELAGEHVRVGNGTQFNKTLRAIHQFRHDDILKTSLPLDEYYPMMEEFDKIIATEA